MTTTHTNTSVLTAAGVDTGNIEFPELEVPVLTGSQRQGDVFILRITAEHDGIPLGKGIVVVAAETNQANTHTLVGDGVWEAHPRARVELVQGWLTVPEGGEAFLIHTEEHNAIGIGPGSYEIRRQREWSNSRWEQVHD